MTTTKTIPGGSKFSPSWRNPRNSLDGKETSKHIFSGRLASITSLEKLTRAPRTYLDAKYFKKKFKDEEKEAVNELPENLKDQEINWA